jgi:hypothetical protein
LAAAIQFERSIRITGAEDLSMCAPRTASP